MNGYKQQAVWPPGSADTVCPRLPLTLTESHLRCGTFLPNLGKLGLWVLKLFAMCTTDGRTDRRTKATVTAPSLRAEHNKITDIS